MKKKVIQRSIEAAAVAATLALVAGCSSDGDTASTNGEGLTNLSVTSVGLCNELSQYAKEKGVFAKHGLNVELLPVQSGSAGIAAMQAGEVDVVFSSPQSVLSAADASIPIKIVANSGLTTEDSQALVVGTDSPINSAADLQGKTVAVNDLNGTIVLLTNEWVERAAGAKSTVKFVALPFPDIAPAAVNGSVDAGAVAAADLVPLEKAATGRSIGNPTFDGVGATPNAIYVAQQSFIEANQPALESFTAAIQEASDMANDEANDTERFEIQSRFCKKDAASIAATPDIEYAGYLDIDAFNNMVGILERGGVIAPDTDTDAIVADFAVAKS